MSINARDYVTATEKVCLKDLKTDGRFNRPISWAWVDRLVSSHKKEAFGSIILSERSDASLIILDGQHRVEVLRQLGLADDRKVIPAVVHKKLSFADEAYLVKTLNDQRQFSAFDKFRALLAAGDPHATHIQNLVAQFDLTIAQGKRDGTIESVVALQRMYLLSEPKGEVLTKTLDVVNQAWGLYSESVKGHTLEGIARYLHQHPEAESTVVVAKLTKLPAGPVGLLGRAKALRGPTPSMGLAAAIAKVIEQEVSKKRPRRLKTA